MEKYKSEPNCFANLLQKAALSWPGAVGGRPIAAMLLLALRRAGWDGEGEEGAWFHREQEAALWEFLSGDGDGF